MPKVNVNADELIEKLEQFSEVNSEENNKTLKEILDLVKEQKIEIAELKKKVTELDEDLKSGKFGVSGGGPTPINPSQDQTSGGGDSTPSGPTEAQQKETQWKNFFSGKDDIIDKDAWKTSNLTIENAQKIYSNGWNKPNLTEYESDGQKTTSLEPLNHKKSEIEKVHKLLNGIKNETDLSKLPSDSDIETYDQSKVPSSTNHDVIKRERDNKLKSLFKDAFEKGVASGLSADEIDKWRTTETGLSKNGTEERKVFDNGWKDYLSNIASGKLAEYKEKGKVIEKDVNVLVVDRTQLLKAYELLGDIGSKKSLHDIPEFYKKDEINELSKYDNRLPSGKKSIDIINKRKEVRNGLWFNLTSTDPRDKGIDSELLSLAETEEKNAWDIREYDPLTPEILNSFLNTCEGVEAKIGKEENGLKDGDNLDQYLKDQGAFEMDAEIIAKEDKLPKSIRGTYSLPLYYTMNNYDKDKPDFCEWEELEIQGEKKNIKRKEVIDTTLPFNLDPKNNNPKKYTDKTIEYLKNKYFENGDIFTDGKFKLKGHLAIGTGVGKTTKTINCLIYMMKKLGLTNNVILVCPTNPLVKSAYNHHKSWLQKWGCVVHQKEIGKNSDGSPIYESHGSYKVEMNKLVDDGLSIMEPKYFNAYMAATLCYTSVLDSSKGGKNVSAEQKAEFEVNVAKIKDYAIPDGALIVFDEADFTIPEYLEMIRDTIILTDDNNNAKFRVLKMSATFKGKKFSINSSYPIESYYTSGFQSGTSLKLEDRLGKGKTLAFLKSIDSKQIKRGIEVLKKGVGEKGTGNGVCHVVYDSTYEAFMEGISFGLPKGAIGIGDTRYGRGFTPDIQNTISSGLVEITTLGDFCKYGKPQTQPYPIAEGAQQRGRGGRIQEGFWGALSTTFEEVRIVPDLISDMVKATILGVVSKGVQGLGAGFAALRDSKKNNVHMGVNFIRVGIALRMIEKNGEAPAPEEMLVGLQGLPEFPTFRSEYPTWKPDKNLWARYMGQPEPDAPNLDVPRAKDLLKLMIQTFIGNDPEFPERLEVKMISSLVQKTELTEAEARQVLNALIVKKIEEAMKEDPTYDPTNKRGKTLSTIQHIAALHKVVLPADKGGTKISMGIEKNEDGDDEYVLRMEYNVTSPTKRKLVLFDEMFQEIRNLIRGEFKGKIKEVADKALRVDSLEGYLAFVKELSENADLYNELIRQKRYESNANKFLHRIEELVKKIETEISQLEAKVEVLPQQ